MKRKIINWFIASVFLFGNMYGCRESKKNDSYEERLESEKKEGYIGTDGKKYWLSKGVLTIVDTLANERGRSAKDSIEERITRMIQEIDENNDRCIDMGELNRYMNNQTQ